MKTIVEFITEALLLEANEQIFPKKGERQKFSIWAGKHYQDRKSERNVTDKEVIDSFWAAYNDLNKKYKDGKLSQTRTGGESSFLIVDCRKDKGNPLNIVGFIYKAKPGSLNGASFTVKTVFKGPDFAQTLHADNHKGNNQIKIFLY